MAECTECGRDDVVTEPDDAPRCSRHVNTRRKYEVEVIVLLTIDGDEEDAFHAVDDLMSKHTVWSASTVGSPHYAMMEGCVTDVTKEAPSW